MSDDFPDRRDGSGATTSFEEWLDRHAEAQGISRQELFEQLISSYWTLNEMVQLLDDSGSDTSLADIYPGSGGDAGAAPTIGGGNDADEDGGRSRGRDRPERRDGDRSDRGRRRRDREDSDQVVALRDRVAELQERLEDLKGRLDGERDRGQSQDKALEAVADRLSGIEADIKELAAESESGRESLAAEYESLADRLDDLEDDVDGRHKQLANEQERLRSRLDAEFDDLETILEYLVERTDDLDDGLTAVERRHDDELSQLRWERKALQSVMAEAAEYDAHAGECEVCGERVNLDLLADPYCSTCDSLLTGVEEYKKWLFFSDVVVTAEETPPGDRSARPESDRPRQVGSAGDPSGSTRDGRGSTGGQPEPTRGERGSTDNPPGSARSEAGSASGRVGSTRDEGGPNGEADDPDPIDFGRSPDTDAQSGDDEPEESAFTFGDTGADADGTGDDGRRVDPTGPVDDPGSDTEAGADTPFGDLEDLRREERRDDEE